MFFLSIKIALSLDTCIETKNQKHIPYSKCSITLCKNDNLKSSCNPKSYTGNISKHTYGILNSDQT